MCATVRPACGQTDSICMRSDMTRLCRAAKGGRFGLADWILRIGSLRRRSGLAWSSERMAPRCDPGWRRALGNLSVLVRLARQRRRPYVAVMSSPSYTHLVGALSTGGGHVKECLRWIFLDPVGFGFRWIHMDSDGMCGLRMVGRLSSAFSSWATIYNAYRGRRHLLVRIDEFLAAVSTSC